MDNTTTTVWDTFQHGGAGLLSLTTTTTTSHTLQTIVTTVILTLALSSLLNRLLHPTHPAIQPSPLRTLLPTLSEPQRAALPYPPAAFPGARDVPTPYGSMRVYEFGPPAAAAAAAATTMAPRRRVLLLHGISTSCMTLTHIAHGLAARGCRVMLYDLFGRGYSDGVGDLPYDERLFVSQALCALASASSSSWLDGDGFDVVGYSLGGGIAVHLAAAVPAVRSVVLLAPAGLIREETFGRAARLVFRSGWVPEGILEGITRWRLKRPIAESARRRKTTTTTPAAAAALGEKMVQATVTKEIADPAAVTPDAAAAEPNELQKRVLAFVNWQVVHHAGFTRAFMSTVQRAPMMGQHATWRKLAARPPRTVCFIFGVGDEIVSEDDYREDALPLVGGEDHVVWTEPVPGAHDFPMVHPEETLDRMWKFWGEQ